MNAPSHILAATDASDASLHAVDRAALLARATGARLTVLHALDLGPVWRAGLVPAGAPVADAILGRVRDALAAILAARPALRHCQHVLRVVDAPAPLAIAACVREQSVGLVVAGAHGAGFLRRLLPGSTTLALVGMIRCPVLVVHRGARRAYRRVLLPVDLQAGAEDALAEARPVAPDAERVLLHVHEDPLEGLMKYAGVDEGTILAHHVARRAQAEERLAALCRAAGTRCTPLVVHGEALREILAVEHRLHCDLVVLVKRGASAAADAVLGSVTRGVLAAAGADVLVCRAAVPAP